MPYPTTISDLRFVCMYTPIWDQEGCLLWLWFSLDLIKASLMYFDRVLNCSVFSSDPLLDSQA